MQPTFEIVIITPALAREMLHGQQNVRLMRPRTVEAYAMEMRKHKWHMTGEPIGFSGPRLINGYHRLNACVKAGVPFTAVVARGLPEASVNFMDAGLKRTIGDSLRADGKQRVDTVAAIGRIIVSWNQGTLHNAFADVSRSDVLAYCEANYEAIMQAINATDGLRRAVRGSGSTYAAAYLRLPAQFRDEFFASVTSGSNLPAGDARLALRNWLFNRSAHRMSVRAGVGVTMIVKAWNAWRAGRSTQALKVPPVGMAIPEIDRV